MSIVVLLFQATKLQFLSKTIIPWITPSYFSVSLHQIPTHTNHSLLNPILPVFILHLKDAFVHELFEVVASSRRLESHGFRNGFWIWNPVIGDKIDDLSPIFFISISIFWFCCRFIGTVKQVLSFYNRVIRLVRLGATLDFLITLYKYKNRKYTS